MLLPFFFFWYVNLKDSVYIMPTKLLKDKNLFDIVKHVLIALEEIGFRLISLKVDNNAINK